MDPIELLKGDHRKVENLFKLAAKARTGEERRAVFHQIRSDLELHARIEETIFYPSFSQYESFDDILDDSYQEHQDIQDMIDEMVNIEDDEDFHDMLEDLQEEVEHHVHMEETRFFPKVRDVMDDTELERLGRMIADAKEAPIRKAA
jgi:hemerythrin superfamily protein